MNTKWSCGAIFGVVLILGIVLGLGLSFLNSGLIENKTGTIIAGFIMTSVPIISLVGVIFGKLGNRFRWQKRVVALITLVISGIGISAIGIGMRNLILSTLPAEEILNKLEGVCQGNGVATAAGFESGQSESYQIVVIQSSGRPDKWSSEADAAWKPESIEDVELVLCLGETQNLYDMNCGYQRSGQERDIWLVDARTGETIATTKLDCGMPACVLVKSGSTDTDCIVNFWQAEDWVERTLNP